MQRKYQKIRKQVLLFVHKVSSKVWYRYLEMSNWAKMSIFAAILWIIWQFLPWIQSLDGATPIFDTRLSANAFNSITWYIWYLVVALLLFVVFSLISSKRKERLKFFSLVDIPDSIIVLYTSWLMMIISIQYFFIIGWLQNLSQNIVFWSWLILSTSSWIILLFGYLLLQNLKHKKKWATLWYETDVSNFKKHGNSEWNMKLPF